MEEMYQTIKTNHEQESENVSSETFSAYDIKLAQIVTLNLHVSKIKKEKICESNQSPKIVKEIKTLTNSLLNKKPGEQPKEEYQLSSVLVDGFSETSLRDAMSKIGGLSPAYSIINVLKNQENWETLARSNTS